jgi:hypothetical protein
LQVETLLLLERRRRVREISELFLVQRLAAHGDKRAVEAAMRQWERM